MLVVNIRLLFNCVLLTTIACSYVVFPAQAEPQIFNWVDESGAVHYGDTVPAEFEDVARTLDADPLNLVSPDAEIAEQNKKAVAALREQDAKEAELKKQQEAEEAAARRQAEIAASQPPAIVLVPDIRDQSRYVTREDCREIHKHVKERLRCYKVADETRRHFIEQHGLSAPPKHASPAHDSHAKYEKTN